jgi:hypothetical protein
MSLTILVVVVVILLMPRIIKRFSRRPVEAIG